MFSNKELESEAIEIIKGLDHSHYICLEPPTTEELVLEFGICSYLYGDHPKRGFRMLELAVDTGDSSADYYLGLCYQKGHGVEKDHKMVMHHLHKSADCASPFSKACLELGRGYWTGMNGDTPKNTDIAFKYYERAISIWASEDTLEEYAQLLNYQLEQTGCSKDRNRLMDHLAKSIKRFPDNKVFRKMFSSVVSTHGVSLRIA